MADKLLKSVTYPGLPDKYIIGDTGLNTPGAAADSKATGDTLAGKANIDGSYENLTAGNAEQIVTDIRANDQTPYLFRPSGGSIDIGDREYINGIVGVSVPWNQLVQNGSFASKSVWEAYGCTYNVSDNVAEMTASTTGEYAFIYQPIPNIQGHKYLVQVDLQSSDMTNFTVYWDGGYVDVHITASSSWSRHALIASARGNGVNISVRPSNSGVVAGGKYKLRNFMAFDLTLMFGSTIADYIYSLEQATAGAGVAWLKALFPNMDAEYSYLEDPSDESTEVTKKLRDYQSGILLSVKGLSSHDMVGFNAWDEEWELGNLDGSGLPVPSNNNIRSKNFTPVVSGATYYAEFSNSNGERMYIAGYDAEKNFVSYISTASGIGSARQIAIPNNVSYIKINMGSLYGTTYNHDICINLSWDGSRNGEYEPYQKWSYPLDSDLELRGIPKLDANNNLYYDGDVYEADGTVTRKYGIVDLGSLSWNLNSGSGHQFYAPLPVNTTVNTFNGVCEKYPWDNAYNANTDMCIQPRGSYVWCQDSSYTSNLNAFANAMDGVYLVYELATPTTETADPYTNPQIVDDFGTEEFVISNTVGVPIPVGHNTDYPINLKAKVEMMPNSPDGDGDYIVRQTNGTNEYVSIANNSTISGLVSRSPVASGADGTYVLKATISGGTVTYSWEAE